MRRLLHAEVDGLLHREGDDLRGEILQLDGGGRLYRWVSIYRRTKIRIQRTDLVVFEPNNYFIFSVH